MKVQKYDEALREKVGSALALALRLARLGGGTTVPPDITISAARPVAKWTSPKPGVRVRERGV